MSVVSTAAPVKTLLSPRRSDQSDGQSSEARDVLPSLPSSSSSTLMFLNAAAAAASPTTGSSRRRRQRVPSLYGNSSAAVSDTKPIQGSSTYEYDVTSNLHRQQARRQRGDSNASISTVASYMSRSRSIADSFTSSIAAYERDGHVHGQFVSNTSGTGNDQASLRSGYGDSLYDGGAAASLRRLGVGNRNGLGPAKSSQGGSGTRSGARAAQPHLNDRLEILIANSASYRAAAAAADRGQGQGRTPLAEIQPSINARHRKSSFASIRSLIGYSSSGAQRQSSTGAYETTTSTSRAASVFGIYMGGGGSRKGDNASKSSATLSSTLRVPTWAAQHAKPSAPTLTTINGEKLATVCRQGDAMGTLKGIRGLQVPSNSGVNQPSQGTKRQNVKELFALDTDSAAGNPNKKAEQGKSGVTSSPQSPTLSDGTAESSRHVSFHATLRKRAAQNNGGNGGGGGGPSPTVVASSSRRAFAALDPTSSNHASGSATPRTVRSAKSPSSSRASSHVDLASLSALGANTPSPTLSAGFSSGADGTATSGAMPALDAALARAEDKSGLKTSSRCTACSKRVINAPVSRSGDVFCSRECRVETKQNRQAAAAAAATATAGQSVPPPVTEPSPATPSMMMANGLRSPTVAAPV